ncbi:DNA cross-link repair 1A protein [Cryptococcus wingfieldii CBS 7118]|uniref:DNA cross-link repair 1A protein n=1 Tax=Cryptococcus wingfieldii CBS 7118 TaxID=1295528 RepID=A0A1E3J584_9TREE|nr:DNA cross-link repair 1A protein [Cryptococcus wingfieldii CBS 7118]ODN95276.1 DNA cross-link repair 1A protein [Cryptococcus wingfieldii CBS 7118]
MAPKAKNNQPSQKNTLLGFLNKGSESPTKNQSSHVVPAERPVKREREEAVAGPSRIVKTPSKVSRKGKRKETQVDGSAHDPVVISDDDDIELLSRPVSPKRRKTTKTTTPVVKKPASPDSPVFAGYPDFEPPPSWPKVINTAAIDDEDGVPPSDEDDARDQDPEDGQLEEDDSGVEMEDDEPRHPARGMGLSPSGSGVEGSLGGMDWEEPDEGMGMEGYGDEEDEPPSMKDGGKSSRPISSFSFTPPAEPSPPPPPPTKGPNAFSLLMSGHKEREQWKVAEDDLRRDGTRVVGRRKAPFYKVMTGMPVAVDAFRYGKIPGVTAYLLTHAHSDHYTNLSKSWTHGPIYCSETTANLIVHMLQVNPKYVHGLPDNIPFEMPNTGGVKVTPLEANHCPGSSIFLFEGPQTINAGDSGFASAYVGTKRIFRYLHCGDFRANPKMILHPAIARAPIHTCYLDTTYLNPKYCFPPQPLVISACATLARRQIVGESPSAPNLEEVKRGEVTGVGLSVGSEGLSGKANVVVKGEDGKETVVEAVVKKENGAGERDRMQGWLVKKEVKDEIKGEIVDEELKSVKEEKKKGRTLVVIGTYSIGKERIVKGNRCESYRAQVHLLPLGNIQADRLHPYLANLHPHFDRVLGFRPTGWSYSPPAGVDMMPDVNTVIRRDQARRFGEGDLKAMRGSGKDLMMYGVPYSEHSSFFELTCFALSLPGPDLKMIATVNVGNEKRQVFISVYEAILTCHQSSKDEKVV